MTRARDQHEAEAQAEIARLTSERDTAIENEKSRYDRVSQKYRMALEERDAIAAAAYEAAKDAVVNALDMVGAQLAGRYDQNKLDFHAVDALTPADARATLDRMLRQAKAEGMKALMTIVAEECLAVREGKLYDAILSRAAEIESCLQ